MKSSHVTLPLGIGLRLPGSYGRLGERREEYGVVTRIDRETDSLAGLAADQRDRQHVAEAGRSSPEGRCGHAEEPIGRQRLIVDCAESRGKGEPHDAVEQLEGVAADLKYELSCKYF